jgi:hypothetical protein
VGVLLISLSFLPAALRSLPTAPVLASSKLFAAIAVCAQRNSLSVSFLVSSIPCWVSIPAIFNKFNALN